MKKNNPDFYQLSFVEDRVGDETLKIHKDMVAHFHTLQDQITDLDGDTETPIPLISLVNREVMQWIIDAYTMLEAENLVDFEYDDTTPLTLNDRTEGEPGYIIPLEDITRNLEKYNRLRQLQFTDSRPLMTLFNEGRDATPEMLDIPIWINVIETLNWLDGRLLLTMTVKKFVDMVHSMSSEDIRRRLGERKKRKYTEEEQGEGLPLSPHYKRVALVHEYLTSVLPDDVVGAKIEVARYINPIATGIGRDIFLTKNGLYGIGSNSRGQLGMPDTIYSFKVLTKLDDPPGVPLLIGCGDSHSVCLTTEGLFVTGANNYGQLGLLKPDSESELTDNEEDDKMPLRVEYSFGWVQLPIEGEVLLIEVHTDSTFVLTTMGLYAWGDNGKYQLGIKDMNNVIDRPRMILNRSSSSSLIAIKAMSGHTVIQTTNGLYGAGDNSSAQISKNQSDWVRTFTLIASTTQIGKIKSIAATIDSTMAVTENGLFVKSDNTPDPRTKIDQSAGKPLFIYGAEYYSILQTTAGLFSTSPHPERPYTDRGTFSKIADIEEIGAIKSITLGSDYTIILTTNGIYVFGYVNRFNLRDDEGKRIASTVIFLPLDFDMGYVWPVQFLDKNQSEQKERRLGCTYCHGEARYISSIRTDNTPICSKYCFYLHSRSK